MNFLSKLFKRKKGISRGSGVYFTDSGDPIFTGEGFYNYANESYLANVYSRLCIQMRAGSVSSVPWDLYRRINETESEKVLESTYLNLFKRPNPQTGFSFFLYETIAYLIISGDAFIQRIKPFAGPNFRIPKELYSLRPDRITIDVNSKTNQISKYHYRVANQHLEFEVDPITMQSDLLQLKFFNPIRDHKGASITKTAGKDIDSDNEAVKWNMRLLQNEARPGMILTYEQNLLKKQRDHLKKEIQEHYTGEGRGKPLILEGALKEVKPYGWSPNELDFSTSSMNLIRRVCAGYQVPPQLVGVPDTSTYANYKEAREAFWDEIIIPDIMYLVSEFNNWLFLKDENLFIKPNFDRVPAMVERRARVWDTMQKTDFLTDNEKREEVGYDAVEGGDTLWKPANLLPIDGTGGQSDEESEEEEEKAIQKLIAQGYSEDEAREALGY